MMSVNQLQNHCPIKINLKHWIIYNVTCVVTNQYYQTFYRTTEVLEMQEDIC